MGDNRLYEVGETSFVVLCDETMLPHLQVHLLSHPTNGSWPFERSTQLPYRGSSNNRKPSGSRKEMKEKALGQGKQNQMDFSSKIYILHFLPHFMWDQGGGQDEESWRMSNATLCMLFVTGSFCVLVSLNQISQTRQHIKVTHPGNSEKPWKQSHRSHKIKNNPQHVQRKSWTVVVGLGGDSYPVSRKKTSTLTPGTFFS